MYFFFKKGAAIRRLCTNSYRICVASPAKGFLWYAEGVVRKLLPSRACSAQPKGSTQYRKKAAIYQRVARPYRFMCGSCFTFGTDTRIEQTGVFIYGRQTHRETSEECCRKAGDLL